LGLLKLLGGFKENGTKYSEKKTQKIWKTPCKTVQDAVDRGWLYTNTSSHFTGLTDLKKLLLTALELANALAYLHSVDVMHGDLTGGNVLLHSSPITPTDPRGFIVKVWRLLPALHSVTGTCVLLSSKIAYCQWKLRVALLSVHPCISLILSHGHLARLCILVIVDVLCSRPSRLLRHSQFECYSLLQMVNVDDIY